MWTLECDGPLFGYKKKWLKPGSRILIGRTKPSGSDDPFHAIDNKSVSKKHLLITVAPVKAGNGSQIFTRSELIIEDSSKLGTTLDGGEKFKESSKVLTGNEHTIQLGRYEHLLRIKWQPVVLSIQALSKAEKASSDPLSSFRKRLEHLDIKTIQEVVPDQTTHVVADKRNVPHVLEALVLGKYVVSDKYVGALVAAASEGTEGSAPLEKDYDGNWPDPMKYIPPSSKEPVPREGKLFAPDPARGNIFSGYTFVFYQATQYESLQRVVNNGSGKALLYEQFQEGVTTPAEVVAYLNTVAGQKLGTTQSDNGEKGLVVVRPKFPKKTEALESLSHDVDIQLGRRSFEQSEFLDTITMNDTSGLRQPLVVEYDLTTVQSSQPTGLIQSHSIPEEPASPISQPPKPEPSSPVKRRGHRQVTQSRFKGFDDFDLSQLPKAQTISEEIEDEPMDDAAGSLQAPSQQVTNTRKRATPPAADNDDDMLDNLLPTAAARKRRRLGRDGSAQLEDKPAVPEPRFVRKPKKETKIDVLEAARSRREAEEEAARKDAESLKEAMEGIDIHGPAKLVGFEEMQVKSRKSRTTSKGDASDRWDEKWNGRKNFKKFRRKGEAQPMRGHRLLVPLEEAKKKDFGIGEDYWLESGSSKQKKKSQPRESQAAPFSTSQTLQNDDEDDSQFRRRPRDKQRAEQVNNDDDAVEVVEDSLLPASMTEGPRGSRNTQESRVKETQTQTQTQTLRGTKRPAAEPAKEIQPPAKKKGRASRRNRDDYSEGSEDELKFRSRRKR